MTPSFLSLFLSTVALASAAASTKSSSLRTARRALELPSILLQGIPRQSTTCFSGDASKAVDGVKNGDFRAGSVTHTCGAFDNLDEEFWRMDFFHSASVEKVLITNRSDCCSERLVGAKVHILDADDNVIAERVLSRDLSAFDLGFAIDSGAHAIKISKTSNTALSLAEVEVFGHYDPDAFEPGRILGSPSQSSTCAGGDAGRAQDGNRNGNFFDGSVTHTCGSPDGDWWLTDFDLPVVVRRVSLYNRRDAAQDRLSFATIELLGLNGEILASQTVGSASTLTVHVADFGEVINVFSVKITAGGNAPLSLAEVEVEGAPML